MKIVGKQKQNSFCGKILLFRTFQFFLVSVLLKSHKDSVEFQGFVISGLFVQIARRKSVSDDFLLLWIFEPLEAFKSVNERAL